MKCPNLHPRPLLLHFRASQAALQSARLNLGYTQVKAPVSGRVGKLEITVGNLVAAGPGAPVLTTLVSVNPIYASFEADERVLAKALQGLKAEGPGELAKIPVEMGTAAVCVACATCAACPSTAACTTASTL
jgi:multidrug efflux system membrane fusion protein